MTSFARAEHHGDLGALAWEVRSVNHRYLEAFVRLPEELRALEPLVRERLAKRLGRGKLDCTLRFKPSAEVQACVRVNHRIAQQVIDAGAEIATLLGPCGALDPMEVLRWPGVMEEEEVDFTPVRDEALELLEKAIDSLIKTRRREGTRMSEIIRKRCTAMNEQVEDARRLMPQVLEAVRLRIRTRLNEVVEELDETRVEQEMALLAQRLDVDEEMDRLATHLEEVARVLDREEPVGRRLDFLMQELNREANTLSSKSSDVEVTRIAVEMKVLIEQMREQVQNIE
jgi:uncharacterized protein (TIGR00255 family)